MPIFQLGVWMDSRSQAYKLGRTLETLGHEIYTGAGGCKKRVPNKDRSSMGGQALESELLNYGHIFLLLGGGLSPQ